MNKTWIARLSMLSLLASLGAAGCEDPAANKPKATVSSAKPAASAKAKPSAKAADDKAASSWTISAADSKLEFVGSKVTGKHEGGFKTFSGKASLAGGKAEGGSVSVEIDMGSLFSDNDQLTGHLKGEDFFDVAKHPKTTFTSTEIKAGGEGGTHTITGNLELHGKTKSITFPATIKVEADAATVTSEFSINRKDFDINYAGKANDLIRDDVVIKLDLKLKKG